MKGNMTEKKMKVKKKESEEKKEKKTIKMHIKRTEKGKYIRKMSKRKENDGKVKESLERGTWRRENRRKNDEILITRSLKTFLWF